MKICGLVDTRNNFLAEDGANIVSCIGLAVFAFYGCIYTTKGAAWLTKMTFVGIAKLFKRRRDA